jgi:hypothetical protein
MKRRYVSPLHRIGLKIPQYYTIRDGEQIYFLIRKPKSQVQVQRHL